VCPPDSRCGLKVQSRPFVRLRSCQARLVVHVIYAKAAQGGPYEGLQDRRGKPQAIHHIELPSCNYISTLHATSRNLGLVLLCSTTGSEFVAVGSEVD
jgi:hypothetical protein